MRQGIHVMGSQLRRIGFVGGAALAAIVCLAPASTGSAPTQTTGGSTAAVTTVATAPVSGSAVKIGAPAGPQLSIAVDNGQTSAVVGDKMGYTISVQNLGTTAVDKLWVTQSVPTGLTFVSADPEGTEPHNGTVTWSLDLKATDAATFHTTMTVGATPADLLRLATVACAGVSKDGTPIVCASDSDQLPAGADAEASQAAMNPPPAPTADGPKWSYIGGGIGLIAVLGALAAIVGLRRRTARTSVAAGDPESVPDNSDDS